MKYTSKKVPNQEMLYEIQTERDGTPFCFNVVSKDGSDLDELVQFHLDFLKNGPQTYVQSYADKRRSEYPSIVDQLDTLYHSGYDGWKSEIQAIKDKYPKE